MDGFVGVLHARLRPLLGPLQQMGLLAICSMTCAVLSVGVPAERSTATVMSLQYNLGSSWQFMCPKAYWL